MPYVLAIEPDPRQAAMLKRLVRDQVRADFVLADSRGAALAAIDARVPDLLLVTTLLSPRDEAEITEHLKTLDGASHLQTLTIPLLAVPAPQESLRGRVLGKFKRHKTPSIQGCAPAVFGEEIATYLQRALELKAEQSQRDVDLRETQDGAPDLPAAVVDLSCADEPDALSVAEQDQASVASDHPSDPPPSDPRTFGPSDPSSLPLLHPARRLPALAPVGRFLGPRAAVRPAATPRRRLLAERSVVESSQTLAVMPSGMTVSVPAAPAKSVAPSPWDRLFRALEQQFDRDDGKWTDLTPLLESLDGDAAEPEQATRNSAAALDVPEAGLRFCSTTEEPCPATGMPQTGLESSGHVAPSRLVPCADAEKPRKRRRRARGTSRSDGLVPIPGVSSLWVANAIAALRLDIERLGFDATSPGAADGSPARGTGVPPTGRSASAANRPAPPDTGQPRRPDGGEPRTDRPLRDEWGVYDPEQCGMAALMARVATQSVREPKPRPILPVDAVVRNTGTPAREARARPGHDDPPGRHLAPLSMWARADAEGDTGRRMAPEPLAHLPALIAGLRLPAHVAAVRYASGCRIRRLRVADRPGKATGGKRQVIILSRKVLRELNATQPGG